MKQSFLASAKVAIEQEFGIGKWENAVPLVQS
jgi:hypothetical protein